MKTIRLIYKIFTILLLSEFLHSCSNPIFTKVDQETKDYCFFDQGSYWLFQDTVTLFIDSVVIINPIHFEIIHSKGSSESELDFYSTNALSYSQEDTNKFDFQLYTDFPEENNSNPCYLLLNYDVVYHNGEINKHQKNTLLLDEKDEYLINEIRYFDVKVFKYSSMGIEKIFYWAKNIGVIRIEYMGENTHSVRNLIRHNVKPYHQ